MTDSDSIKQFDWKPWVPTHAQSNTNRGQVMLIAEIANAHEGRVSDAMKMIEAAATAGCDAIKFQKYYANEMLSTGHSMMSKFASWEWDEGIWRELFEAAAAIHLKVFVDVFGVRAYQSLANLPPVDGLKIHSADISNYPLLDLLAKTSCPILIGTGGSSDLDLYHTISALGQPERIVLMHGYQSFPTPLADTALKRISYLLETFGVAIGLSEHLDADDSFAKIVPLVAIPLGVCCIEKHIILNRAARGVDSASSLNPDEMAQMVQWARQAEVALGQFDMPPSVSESGYRRRFKKSLVAAKQIFRNEVIADDQVAYRIVENPTRFSLSRLDVTGQMANRDISAGAIISALDLGMKAGLCLIARLKSQRLPRKALVDIHGKPALAHLFERAHLCQSVERAILCTSTDPDDAPLLRLARQYNFQSYAGSPEQPLERMIACAETYGWQYIVRATADNIFLDPDLVEKSVTYAMDQNLDYVFTRGVPIGTHCEVFSLSALRSIQQYADAPYTTEYLTWFVTDTDNFHAMDLPIPDSLKRNYRLTLDTPDDLRNICDVMERLKEISVPYTLIDVIRVVESNPDLQRRCVFEPKYEPPPTKVHFKFNIKLPA